MRSRRILALICAAPMTLTWLGCTNSALRPVSRLSAPSGAASSSYTARMMQLAERYEQQENHEGALRLYRQIAETQPGHSSAESRIEAIVGQSARTAEGQPETSLASQSREASPPQVAATPQRAALVQSTPQLPTRQAAATVQAAAALPREMPFVEMSTVREEPPANDDVATPAWAAGNNDSQVAASSEDSGAETVATLAPLPGWAAHAAPQSEPASAALDLTEAAPLVAASSGPAWARTSCVHLCPNAGEELQSILAQLDGEDPETRKQAMIELADLGIDGAAALPAVRMLLNEPDGSIRAHAAWAAWSIGDSDGQAVPALASLTQSGRDDVVQIAAFFLGSIGEDAQIASATIREVRNCSFGITRLHLAEALVRIDPRDLASLNELTVALRAEDPELRWLAAVALSGVSPEQASWVVPALAARLSDSDASVCSAAALSLGSLGPAANSAVGSLESAAAHPTLDVRNAAEAALACIQR